MKRHIKPINNEIRCPDCGTLLCKTLHSESHAKEVLMWCKYCGTQKLISF
ncbi:hypothetical protein HZF24_04565 [Sedimentibacter hydroxybenzoicus DSM 7310]|uniref:C2H2-type domain-containing protein n=1 Tax=Sedimentibacter hydroxybenzoicus DSM 7310 TaxID=1123245 RepID=A0A974BHR6_SEDHY|nr:hypothetical protein [Sedimentibacter hydroxybenzoicus]NYB73409.1 hypothetical protein [Sedimentibacter hydroxybenzoicus DSM 7310]